jgi:hypothetical protein
MSLPDQDDADADPRPWEEPDGVRRDCLRDRAPLLNALSAVAALCTVSGWCLCAPAGAGFALGVLVWVMARHDLRLMDAGVMDPAGQGTAERAEKVGFLCAWSSLIPLLASCVLGWNAPGLGRFLP